MSARFVVVVHDVGQAEDQSQPDVGLEFLRRWWDAGGWTDEPIYLAAVPAAMGEPERQMLRDMERDTGARICLHGWDHHPHELSREDIERAHEVFPTSMSVCPPYLRYNHDSLLATERVLNWGATFFGGFYGQHQHYRDEPYFVNDVLHLPAREELYRHSYRMVEYIEQAGDPGYPLVVNVHNRWDAANLKGVGELRRALQGKLITVEEAWRELS